MIPWSAAHQALLSMGFPRQEYWHGLSFPSSGELPDPGIKSMSPALRVDSLLLSHQGSLKPGLHRPFSRTGFLPLYPGDREILLEEGHPIQNSFAVWQCSGPPPSTDDFHPNVKIVHLTPNTTSPIQPMEQGIVVTFRKYYLRHTFCQAVKVSNNQEQSCDNSGRTKTSARP